jgi:hypothetical protein
MKAILSQFALGSLLIVVSLGCANTHCRQKKAGDEMSQNQNGQQTQKILVAKADGSRQCEEKSGTSLDRMAKDLGEVKIYRQFKQNDGMMRIQVCGAPTGMYNVYEIEAKDQQAAVNVGFQVWKGSQQ